LTHEENVLPRLAPKHEVDPSTCVNPSDTTHFSFLVSDSLTVVSRRESIEERLRKNRARREKAEKELERARAELAKIVRGGRDTLTVSAMAQLAGISRETAHKLLRNR
jgi:hypothetical protein